MAFIRGDDFLKHVKYRDFSDVWTGLVLLFLALIFIFLGALFCERIFYSHKNTREDKIMPSPQIRKDFVSSLRIVSLTLFWVSLLFSFAEGIGKILFIQSHAYIDYYSQFSSKLPFFVAGIAALNRYCLCFFLATLPCKKLATAILIAYGLSTIPGLLVGGRGGTVLALFLGLIYYMMRDYYNSGGQLWLGKKEKRLMIVTVPLLLMFLAAYNYIRSDIAVQSFAPFALILDFFYGQGTTFGWFCSGLGAYDRLPDGVISYTFGSFIDYFKYSRSAQLFWGGVSLGDASNNLLRATMGNNLAHHLSYLLLGDLYLRGRGVGSCYILEVFIDFGYIGVALFCFILGSLLVYAPRFAQKGLFQYSVVLIALDGILIMPRGMAISPIVFLIRTQFLFAFAVCFGYSLLLSSAQYYAHKKRRTSIGSDLPMTCPAQDANEARMS